jgi:sulfate adenylyltransferase subunit 2
MQSNQGTTHMSSTLDSTVNAPIANRGDRMDHLDWLEAESIHILRELVAEAARIRSSCCILR